MAADTCANFDNPEVIGLFLELYLCSSGIFFSLHVMFCVVLTSYADSCGSHTIIMVTMMYDDDDAVYVCLQNSSGSSVWVW